MVMYTEWNGQAFVERRDLRRAQLEGRVMVMTDLAHADLSHANLQGAALSHADLQGATLFQADLREADLSGADLTGANLEWAAVTRTQAKQLVKATVKRHGPSGCCLRALWKYEYDGAGTLRMMRVS